MEDNADFKIIGNIGQLSLSQKDVNSLKIDFRILSDSEYELFFSILGSNRIILAKFALNNSFNIENKDIDQSCIKESSTLKLSLWKTVSLPFNINHFTVSRQSLWTLGENFYVDISSYLKPIFKVQESDQPQEDLMDIDASDELHLEEFETSIEIASTQKYKSVSEKFFLDSHLFDDDIIICSKDAISMTWHLDLIIPSHDLPYDAQHSKIFNLINFPVTYNESSGNLLTTDVSKPVIIFLYDKESSGQTFKVFQMNLLKKLLGIYPLTSSNSICFIGHPEGKLLYYLCTVSSKEKNIHTDTQPEMIYDIRQPIKGIHFQRELTGIKGNSSLLIIGKQGKLAIITAEKVFYNSTVIKIKNESLYVTTLYLPSSIESQILLKQSVIFISNKTELWVSELTNQETSVPHRNQEIKLSKTAVAMSGVVKMILLNKLQGLFLLVTRSGHLYLSEYCKQKADFNLSVSLSSLMNMIMHQSSILHNLSLLSKMHQDFFVSVSKFASLKYNGIQKLNVACSVTELDEPPKKYVININIATNEKFDPRFWFVTGLLKSCD